nr:hypothetical protein CFP56_35627 [Quercus suber]
MKKFFALDEKLTLLDLPQERQRISEGLLDYIHRFRDLSLIYYDLVEEERLVDICIVGMLNKYRPYLENMQILSFTRLVEASRRTSMSVRKPIKSSTTQATSTPKHSWKRESEKTEVAVVKETKKVTKDKKSERNGIPTPFFVSTEELYSILEAWVRDGMVVLPECKCEPTEEEKRGALYCRYHRRSDHYTMDCYALRNIFHENVAKCDLVIKNRKCIEQRMHRPEVVMTSFIGCKDPMEEEAGSLASNSAALPPLQDEEMVLRIQQDDKVHSFLEGIALRPLARREAAQALTRVVKRS